MLSIKRHVKLHNSIALVKYDLHNDHITTASSINDTRANNFVNVHTEKVVSAVITDFEDQVKQEFIIIHDVNSDDFSGMVTYT